MFTSLEEIQAYIEECEQKRLDLDNEEVWSKVYLPAKRTTEAWGNCEGKVIFKNVQIRLVASNEPLMGCGPLPNWLRNNRCIYAIDKFDDNLCVWSCLAIYNRKDIQKGTEAVTRTALSLAREYYSDKNLKKRDVKPTRLVDFEGIAKRHNVIVMFYEPKKNNGKNAGSVWWLVYGKLQHKSDLPTINLGLWGVIVFTLRRWMCFVINGL